MRGWWMMMAILVLATAGGAGARATALLDSDGDGLPDEWERHGVTIDAGAGPRFIDLPAMGADPMRPNSAARTTCTPSSSSSISRCEREDVTTEKSTPFMPCVIWWIRCSIPPCVGGK